MPHQTLNANQARAVSEHGKNIVVIAGAGTGKTSVLVERYLALLERSDCPLASIVAITFTEKAASEMRARIREAIEERAQVDAQTWERRRAEIDSAQVSTIHSLCARLLRANPVEAGVDPRFGVLDEADAGILQDQVVDTVLTRLAETGGAALQLFEEYDTRAIRETLKRLFQHGAAAAGALAGVPGDVDGIVQKWQADFRVAQREGLDKLINGEAWRSAAAWVQTNAASRGDDRLETVRQAFDGLLEQLGRVDQDGAIQVLREIGSQNIGNVGSKDAWEDVKAARQRVTALRGLAKDYGERYDLVLCEADRRAAALVLLWRDLWEQAIQEYKQRKQLQRLLDFNDLEERARDLLLNCREVRERYRSEVACVLVDEFQDTNRAQCDIIFALAAPEEPDRLFVVGDAKQSIYGFRGADVTVFAETRKKIRRYWGEDAVIPLDVSFRTHHSLMEAYNHLFGSIFAVDGKAEGYEIEYEGISACRATRDGHGPLIRILPIREDKSSETGAREREAQALAGHLRKLVEEEYPVWDHKDKSHGNPKYRPAGWSDIALLLRATTHVGTYEQGFKTAGIPYRTFAGKGYYDRPEVRDLIQLLRALDNPSDHLALATVLRSPLYALSDETLYRLRRGGEPLYQALASPPDDLTGGEREHTRVACRSLSGMWKRVGRVPILDLLNTALADTDYLATLSSLADGDRRCGNVDKLLGLARRTGLVRLSEFNAYLQKMTAQEIHEGEAVVDAENAVQIMSIHRAKGLEFAIVVIPDASRALREHSDRVLVHQNKGLGVAVHDAQGKRVESLGYRLLKLDAMRRGEAEEKRLLYVAATRARDYLVISGELPALEKKGKPDKSYLGQVMHVLDGQTTFPWGMIKVCEPEVDFSELTGEIAGPATGAAAARDAAGNLVSTELPQLARPLSQPSLRDLQWFSPTGLESLVHDPVAFQCRFVDGTPDRVPSVIEGSRHVPAYIVGDVAHRSLRQWRFPGTTPGLATVLAGYARDCGLTDEQEVSFTVRAAERLLQRFEHSDLFQEIQRAAKRRHEVPFVTQWEGRWVQGAIDVLWATQAGEWCLADFKTDRIRDTSSDVRAYTCKTYGVQLAMYHHAVAARFGHVAIYVHYLREGCTVLVSNDDLTCALETAKSAIAR